ncbi:hypothetical protein COO09_17060 [Rhizorhabdus dicambivorans]|uniref:Uncharacterized protein n=1 Tax=Rhizorhabdus dicambivorans TaxID=1850238 RepID=A0A2A4FSA2_9SPHN|nr:hypothetical protein CMV14_20260 [Rhizorhabdus dicambivorans]PCE41057.1 hypothetical protein COO09_17060 [Rhizorhabdus dicambivorans]
MGGKGHPLHRQHRIIGQDEEPAVEPAAQALASQHRSGAHEGPLHGVRGRHRHRLARRAVHDMRIARNRRDPLGAVSEGFLQHHDRWLAAGAAIGGQPLADPLQIGVAADRDRPGQALHIIGEHREIRSTAGRGGRRQRPDAGGGRGGQHRHADPHRHAQGTPGEDQPPAMIAHCHARSDSAGSGRAGYGSWAALRRRDDAAVIIGGDHPTVIMAC